VSLNVAITATHIKLAKNVLQIIQELKITKYPRVKIPVTILQWTSVPLKIRRVSCPDKSGSEQ